MQFKRATAEVFVPDGRSAEQALARTTHLAIAAHQDDLEIMAITPILACFQRDDEWFTGVVVTDGRGSPRNDVYAQFSDEAMREVRASEQKKAAVVGEYSAQVLLDYPSAALKGDGSADAVHDLALIVRTAAAGTVYTHNLADKHDTHVAVTLRTIAALRTLSADERPKHVYGCEVWRGLDWLVDAEKVLFDCSRHESLQAALLGVFDSQICGGKRYDLATLGRRRANATYFASHGTDTSTGLAFGMDLTPLVDRADADIEQYIQGFVSRFSEDIGARIRRLQ